MSRVEEERRPKHEDESSSDGDNDAYDDDELDDEECEPVKGLFTDNIFKNVIEMFQFEANNSKFNLVEVLKKYGVDSMLDYIKLINFIRAKKPDVNLFQTDFKSKSNVPWMDDVYLKTVIENDPVLQFDIEEDLDLLLNEEQTASTDSTGLIKNMEKKLYESEAKNEELIEMVGKLKKLANNLLEKSSKPNDSSTDDSDSDSDDDDSVYVNSYSNYSIHLEMLQDQVRTESYMNSILKNSSVFENKVVLDVGCGTGILSMFAAKAGAKLVIAVDMSEIIHKASQIAKENGFDETRIKFLKGKVEEVKLPVDKVDVIISEWMGYFLLFESMLDSVLFARDRYLSAGDGLVLPNFFEMHLFGVSDEETHQRTVSYWSDVYGFKMDCMRPSVLHDAQVRTIDEKCVVTDLVKFKQIDCMTCTVADVAKFESDFTLKVTHDASLTGLGASFDTFFNHPRLTEKVSFSTSPFHKTTHWEQTLFQIETPILVKKDSIISGHIVCYKNPEYLRSYMVELEIFNKTYKYKIN